MDSFHKRFLTVLAVLFFFIVGSSSVFMYLVATHSHEIAQATGALAHDFMEGVRGSGK